MSSDYEIVKFVSQSDYPYGIVEGDTVVKTNLPDPKAARAWLKQYTVWEPQ